MVLLTDWEIHGRRGGVEVWRSAEAGFRQGEEKMEGKEGRRKKKADGRAGMCASHLKGGEAHSLLRGCVASLATK